MLWLITGFFGYLFGWQQKPPEEDIDAIVLKIENATRQYEDSLKNDNDKTIIATAPLSQTACFYKTGKITLVRQDFVSIDDKYSCAKENVFVDDVKVGDAVNYLAYQMNDNEDIKVSKVLSLIDDSWGTCVDGSEDQVEIQKKDVLTKTIIGKVNRREGRRITVDPQKINVDLNNVSSNFIPYIGDWVKVTALVELDEESSDLGGQVLEVTHIEPSRSKLVVGVVTSFEPGRGQGLIDQTIIFSKKCCEAGYQPSIGDKVVTDSIESDQSIYSWRSLTVVPLFENGNNQSNVGSVSVLHSLKSEELRELLADKKGIQVSSNVDCTVNLNEEQRIIVLIRNTGTCTHVVSECLLTTKSSQTQLFLTWPEPNKVTCLKPKETISYIFKCKGKFMGTSEELVIFKFGTFRIGRVFRISVDFKRKETIGKTENGLSRYEQYNAKPKKQNTFDEDPNYISGVRPFKPANFIAVRPGVFKIPQEIWDAVLIPLNQGQRQDEQEIAIGDAIYCLQKDLRFDNYKERFHALLYLEEIAQSLELQKYDLENVCMRHCGEYIALEVPGLAERRPSLLTGDKAIVSFVWDDTGGKKKYEGCIHKTNRNDIFLKFHPQFHSSYNGEACHVVFQCSRTPIRRGHTAVNLAINQLGKDTLFPTRVVEREAQVELEEENPEEKPQVNYFTQTNHNRSESISSACSISSSETGTNSGSDASGESVVKSPPKISVIERLFIAKKKSRQAQQNALSSKTNLNCQSKPTIVELKNNLTVTNNRANSNLNSQKRDDKKMMDKDKALEATVKKRKLVWFNGKLNYYQKEAVKNILRGVARPLPYVIFGPPGTGKTVTLSEAILQVYKTMPESRLIVATPSNSSANLIAERLLDSKVLQPGDLVRLVARHCLDDSSIPDRLLPYCATGDLSGERSHSKQNFKETNGVKLNCTSEVLGRHRITVGTCVALGLLYNMGFPKGHFTHVFVDEAGQATEPEIMIPSTFIHADYGQIILAGDPMQLGPVVQSKLAGCYGFGESFLARILRQFPYQRDTEGFEFGYDPRLVTKLIINYRSLPEILHLPSTLFYESELQPHISETTSPEAEVLKLLSPILPEREGSPPAVVFHGVNGENLQDPDSPSWYNPQESTQVYLYLVKLFDLGLTPDDIGIIAPYLKQVRQIRELLMELDMKLPKIGSVEEFQGQERKVIILSTVRSASELVGDDVKHALGFVRSPRRLNVAISRAKCLLIIIGNPYLLSKDVYWRRVYQYCVNNRAYTGCTYVSSCTTESSDSFYF